MRKMAILGEGESLSEEITRRVGRDQVGRIDKVGELVKLAGCYEAGLWAPKDNQFREKFKNRGRRIALCRIPAKVSLPIFA